jgi:hypothetical protein
MYGDMQVSSALPMAGPNARPEERMAAAIKRDTTLLMKIMVVTSVPG